MEELYKFFDMLSYVVIVIVVIGHFVYRKNPFYEMHYWKAIVGIIWLIARRV